MRCQSSLFVAECLFILRSKRAYPYQGVCFKAVDAALPVLSLLTVVTLLQECTILAPGLACVLACVLAPVHLWLHYSARLRAMVIGLPTRNSNTFPAPWSLVSLMFLCCLVVVSLNSTGCALCPPCCRSPADASSVL